MNKQVNRIFSIDLLRGLIMVIMALDHVRDYFHEGAMLNDPLDLDTTTPLLFFTRWITHYCAPVFFLLAGVSAYLGGLKKSSAQHSAFLVKRGLWLIVMEFAIVNFGWTFNPFFHTLVFQVIWALGISMVLLGLLLRLSYRFVFVSGIAIILLHNLFDSTTANGQSFWFDLLFSRGSAYYPVSDTRGVLVIYGFLPWAGIMFCGYALGKWFGPAFDTQRRKWLLLSGTGMILCFVILRSFNFYGDPFPWSQQKNGFYSFLSFLDVNKYPASLLYTCMTIGPALIFLALSEKTGNAFSRYLAVFGRVPFFYYVLHIYVIHLLVVILFFFSGYGEADIISQQSPFFFRPARFGYGLCITYLVWLAVIVLLFPLCRWYNHYKSRKKHWWLSYL